MICIINKTFFYCRCLHVVKWDWIRFPGATYQYFSTVIFETPNRFLSAHTAKLHTTKKKEKEKYKQAVYYVYIAEKSTTTVSFLPRGSKVLGRRGFTAWLTASQHSNQYNKARRGLDAFNNNGQMCFEIAVWPLDGPPPYTQTSTRRSTEALTRPKIPVSYAALWPGI